MGGWLVSYVLFEEFFLILSVFTRGGSGNIRG